MKKITYKQSVKFEMSESVEVDQSGKIGDTKVHTVLAFSNSYGFSILIPANVKRECIKIQRPGTLCRGNLSSAHGVITVGSLSHPIYA